MPELPEVEIVRRSLDKKIKQEKVIKVIVRNRNLRFKIPSNFAIFLKDQKILVIDDLLATGGTAEAAGKLVKMCGGKVAGFLFVINLFDLPGNDLLKKKSYFTESLIEFPGH